MNKFTPGPWYSKATSADQALIISEKTGANVAVAYDKQDGDLLAAAPDMARALEAAKVALDHALRNVESMEKMLPLKAPAVERQSLQTWAAGLRQARDEAAAVLVNAVGIG